MTDWQDDVLENCLEALLDYRGKSPPKSSVGIPVLSAKVVKTSGLLHPIEQKIASDYYSKWMVRGLPHVGDVVMTTEGPMGEVIQLTEETVQYALGQRIVCLRGKSGVLDNTFLRYLLSSPSQQNILESYSTGTTVPGISQKALRSVPISYPSFDTQKRIGILLSSIDDKIDLNRRTNETLEAMARALFRDWFIDFGPTRAKIAGEAPYLAPELWELFPDKLDEEGKPEGWETRPVKDFANLKGGKQLAKDRIASTGRIPVFGGAGIMGFTDLHNADEFVIVVGRVGAYCGQFFSHRGKAWVNNNASLIDLHDNVSGEWLFQALKQADIDVIKKGAAQPFVSNSDVAELPIMWPGTNVISIFTKALCPLILKSEQNEEESRPLTQLRDLLLPKLMSGEISIRDAEKMVEDAA